MNDYRLNSNDYQEIIQYGTKRLRIIIVELLVVFLLGGIFNILLQSIVYMSILFLLRRYAGGFHTDTEITCYIFSFFIVLLSLLIIRCNCIDLVSSLVIHSICFVIIIVLSPIDNKNKPLSKDEYNEYRNITRLLSAVIFSVSLLLYFLNKSFLLAPILIAYVNIALLLILGFIKNTRQ